MKFTRRPWGIFKRARDPTFKGRGPEILISTHHTSFAAEKMRHRGEYVRRLERAERNPQ